MVSIVAFRQPALRRAKERRDLKLVETLRGGELIFQRTR